jgi:carbonic anhydrase
MLRCALLLFLCQAVHLVYGAGGNYGADWRYGDYKGPDTWKNIFPACGHENQSPINIMSGDAIINKGMGELELENYEQEENVVFVMKNRDTDIEFKAKANSEQPKDIPQAIIWNGTKYRLYQLHFHWGLETHQGSEHQINSQQYAAEMHIIHYNDKYANVGEAIDKPDGLLVWGHFLQVTSETHIVNPYFKSLSDDFDYVKNASEHGTKDVTINLRKLLPKNVERYYHYTGSLTTPPCHESVKWIVNPNPIRVSEQLMNDELRVLIDGPMSKINNNQTQMGDNYRPIQPLNDRKVYANFDPTDESCSAAPKKDLKYDRNFPKNVSVDDGDDVQLKLVLEEKNDLWFCCSDEEDVCSKVTGVKNESSYVYPVSVNAKRSFCGKEFGFKSENDNSSYSYSTRFNINFTPNRPVIKKAQYDLSNNCLEVEIEAEDTGKCQLKYTVDYQRDMNKGELGGFTGTKMDFQGRIIKSCWNETRYNNGTYHTPTVKVQASSNVDGMWKLGDAATKEVTAYTPKC